MAELGELCLWAALPMAGLSAIAAIGGGWTRRGDLAMVGGRAAEAAAALVLLGLAGLGYALLEVQLKYAYVAGHSGFQVPFPWRVAAVWSGPEGGALTLTFLIAACAALSCRLGRSRQAAARTGSLSALVLFGLLLVLVQARPFAQPPVPATVGLGLTVAVRDLLWQIELGAAYLATACAAFTFAGVTGEQLAESPGQHRAERSAAAAAAGALTVATLAAAWRAYAATGKLLDAEGLSWTLVHCPSWLLAVAYLHAPGGPAVPAWAATWYRIFGVALFPAVVGGAAATVGGQGLAPPVLPWAGGLAVGIITGAMAGVTRPKWRTPGLERVPGFGLFALLGGFIAMVLAGLAAVWALIRGGFWASVAPPVLLLTVAFIVAWSVFRPAGRWRAVWPVAAGLAVAAGVAAFGLSGWRAPVFAVAAGLLVAALVGSVAEFLRLAKPQNPELAGAGARSWAAAAFRARARRRAASVAAHLGAAFLVFGLSADELTKSETRMLAPGDTLSSAANASGVRATYLGLSHYRVGDLDKTVASFMLYRGHQPPSMVTAEITFDWLTGRQQRTPAVQRAALSDVVIGIAGRGEDEGLLGTLAVRPLASAVWLGGALLVLSMLGAGRSSGRGGSSNVGRKE